MDPLTQSRPHQSPRDILKSSALALLPLGIPSANYSLHDQQPMTANGSADPIPIPWVDKNGSHNQPAGPKLEHLRISTISRAEVPGAAPLRPANSIHELHPSIAPSGLYWVVSVPERDLTISPDENTFTLGMQNVTVVDQPRWPAQDSIATPARMSFKMVWKSTGECVEVRLCHYRGRSQRSLRRQLFVRLVLRYKI